MSALQIGLLLSYAIGMSIGQVLFKYAALSFSPSAAAAATTLGRILQLGSNPYFLAALILYLLLSVLWVWLLSFTSLSRAYPFVALAFIVTPLFGHFIFLEALEPKFYFGIGFIVVGLVLVIG